MATLLFSESISILPSLPTTFPHSSEYALSPAHGQHISFPRPAPAHPSTAPSQRSTHSSSHILPSPTFVTTHPGIGTANGSGRARGARAARPAAGGAAGAPWTWLEPPRAWFGRWLGLGLGLELFWRVSAGDWRRGGIMAGGCQPGRLQFGGTGGGRGALGWVGLFGVWGPEYWPLGLS